MKSLLCSAGFIACTLLAYLFPPIAGVHGCVVMLTVNLLLLSDCLIFFLFVYKWLSFWNVSEGLATIPFLA